MRREEIKALSGGIGDYSRQTKPVQWLSPRVKIPESCLFWYSHFLRTALPSVRPFLGSWAHISILTISHLLFKIPWMNLSFLQANYKKKTTKMKHCIIWLQPSFVSLSLSFFVPGIWQYSSASHLLIHQCILCHHAPEPWFWVPRMPFPSTSNHPYRPQVE